MFVTISAWQYPVDNLLLDFVFQKYVLPGKNCAVFFKNFFQNKQLLIGKAQKKKGLT